MFHKVQFSFSLLLPVVLLATEAAAQTSPAQPASPQPAEARPAEERQSLKPTAPAPAWTKKSIAEWNEADARQILLDSPWSRNAAPNVMGSLTAAMRREGGNMDARGGGVDGGVGFDNFGLLGTHGAPAPRKGQGPEGPHYNKLIVRWESALPIRAAEVRVNDPGAPVLEGDEYAIAVYNIDLKIAKPDPIGLAGELKKIATLRINDKREVKPSRVVLVELGNKMVNAIYLFPRSANITLSDEKLTFEAQIGRITLAQYFFPGQMVYQGKLKL